MRGPQNGERQSSKELSLSLWACVIGFVIGSLWSWLVDFLEEMQLFIKQM